MRIFHKNLLLLFLLCGANLSISFAQGDHVKALSPARQIGFQLGYGSHHLLNIDYDYRVSFFQVQYFRSLMRKPKWAIEVLVQPQFNVSRYRFSVTEPALRWGREFGLNAGILGRRIFSEGRYSIYLCLSAGPHYVSGAPRRQSSGFIFSDNLFAGLQAQIKRGCYLDVRIGGRHISNANLETPNGGVNSLFGSLGFNWKMN